jgi:hypothetical protein
MVSAIQIRDLVQKYLLKAIDGDAFICRLSELSYDIHLSENQAAILLSNQVELRLGQHQSGLISENELRKFLIPLISVQSVSIEISIPREEVGASDAIIPTKISSQRPDPSSGLLMGFSRSSRNAQLPQMLPLPA